MSVFSLLCPLIPSLLVFPLCTLLSPGPLHRSPRILTEIELILFMFYT